MEKNELQVYTTNVEITSENIEKMNELNNAYTNVTKQIKNNMNYIFRNFLEIAALLHEAKKKEIYKWVGYNDIYEYAYNEFDFTKTTVKNYIQIASKCLEFSNDDPTLRKGVLLDKYKDYNYSQLVELLNVPELDLDKYNPEMSVRQIKENRFIENFKTYFNNMIDLKNSESNINEFINSLKETLNEKFPNEILNFKDKSMNEDLSLILSFNLNKDEFLFELSIRTYYNNQLNISIWGSSYLTFRYLDLALEEAKNQLIKQATRRIEERNSKKGQTSDQQDNIKRDIFGQTSDQENKVVEPEYITSGSYEDFFRCSDFDIEVSHSFKELIKNIFGNKQFNWYHDNTVEIILDKESFIRFDYSSDGNVECIYDFKIELGSLVEAKPIKEFTIKDLFDYILTNKYVEVENEKK